MKFRGQQALIDTRGHVEALRKDNRYAVLEARDDLQALNVQELESLLRRGDVFFEGHPNVARALQTHPRLVGVNRPQYFSFPAFKGRDRFPKGA